MVEENISLKVLGGNRENYRDKNNYKIYLTMFYFKTLTMPLKWSIASFSSFDRGLKTFELEF